MHRAPKQIFTSSAGLPRWPKGEILAAEVQLLVHYEIWIYTSPILNMDSFDLDEGWDSLPVAEYLPYATMLSEFENVNILAPLVRCSKLPFRHLTSLYETHVTHTPMILAPEFSRSQKARTSDFTTSKEERGVFWMEPRNRTSGAADEEEDIDFDQPGPSRRPDTTGHSRLPPTLNPPTASSRLVRGCLIAQFASPNGPCLSLIHI